MTGAGGIGSENADMSSENSVRNTVAEYPRVPAQGSSAQGEPAPKARPKGVVDGNLVNIPGPAGGDEFRNLSGLIGLSGQGRSSWK